MKFNPGICLAGDLQVPFAFRHVNRSLILVVCDVTAFMQNEFIQQLSIGGRDPACLVIFQRIESAGGAVFVQQSELNYFKLQFSDSTNDFGVVGGTYE